MATEWRSVRVFISSTFRDMHSERDYLVKVVFPALRERLEPHRIHLIDIDLRWGITAEQSDNDQVLDLCLDQIDECRPFFVGILGERYGWVPESFPRGESKHGWTQHHTGKSVTELEILWGVLLREDMHGRGLFFFRDPAFTEHVPEAMRPEVEAENPQAQTKLRQLKDRICSAGLPIPVTENYSCQYAGLRINWGLARFELDADDISALENIAQDGLVDNEEYKTLHDRLRFIVHQYASVHVAGLEEFGRQMLDRLWNAIREELQLSDSDDETKPRDPLEVEQEFHERFMESRLRVYVGRQSLQEQLVNFIENTDGQVGLLTGESGSGKSAALARLVTSFRSLHPDTLVIPHFVGASPESTSAPHSLKRLCSILKYQFDFDDEVPTEPHALMNAFRQFVWKIPDHRRVLIVIDALDQLDESDNAHQMHWLPWEFPPHVKLVMSCIEDAERENVVLRSMKQRQLDLFRVPPLTNQERFEIVRQVPSISAKSLEPAQIQMLLENPSTTSPLFLLVALEELRGFGSFEQLNRRIAMFPSGEHAVTQLFEQVIDRLEIEFDSQCVRDVLCLLACSRKGLSDRELLGLIEGSTRHIEQSRSDLLPILRQLRPYLQYRGELRDFFHRGLDKAVSERFLTASTRRDSQRRIADFFHQQSRTTDGATRLRALAELAWQYNVMQEWHKQYQLLSEMDVALELSRHDRVELQAYWAAVEQNYERGVLQAIEPMLADPARFPEHLAPFGQILFDMGRYAAAETLFNERVRQLEQSSDDQSLCEALGLLARAIRFLSRRSRREEVLALHQREEQLCRSTGNLRQLALCLGDQAQIASELEEFDRGIELRKEQEVLARRIGHMDALQMCLGDQAVELRRRNEFQKALEVFHEAESICRRIGQYDGLIAVLLNQSDIYNHLEDGNRACSTLNEVESLSRKLGAKYYLGHALCRKARMLAAGEQLTGGEQKKGALKAALEAKALFQEIGQEDGVNEANSLIDKATSGSPQSGGNRPLRTLQQQSRPQSRGATAPPAPASPPQAENSLVISITLIILTLLETTFVGGLIALSLWGPWLSVLAIPLIAFFLLVFAYAHLSTIHGSPSNRITPRANVLLVMVAFLVLGLYLSFSERWYRVIGYSFTMISISTILWAPIRHTRLGLQVEKIFEDKR